MCTDSLGIFVSSLSFLFVRISDFRLLTKGTPEFDSEGPFLKRFQELCPGIDYRDGIFYHMCRNIPEPRLIKHHIPYIFLNPDIFEKGKKLTLENFVEDFINGKVILSYWEHLRLNWEKRDHPNFHFVFYEDLKEKPKIEIRKIDQFLGTKRTDEQIDNIVNCTSFSYMKKKWKHNPPTSYDNVFLKTDGEDKSITFFRKDIYNYCPVNSLTKFTLG
ncbi:Sulfotransferase 1C4 [Armadillidium vulgare]|nr:Sulfotransferase 1C4 [Armadillidium vulgare]